MKKHTYYHVSEKSKRTGRPVRRRLTIFAAIILMAAGVYLFVLVQSPALLVNETAASQGEEQTLIGENQDFIKIERLNLLLPYNTGKDEKTLERGAWYRYPERGSPEGGGNFILSAHRFKLGATPNATKERSPFYHIDKLQKDDVIDIYGKGKWYSYRVTDIKNVPEDATEIEAPSDTAKLTLYTCSLKGSADGRVVIEALPFAREAANSGNDSSNPIL